MCTKYDFISCRKNQTPFIRRATRKSNFKILSLETSWSKVSVDIDGPALSSSFGQAIAISSDGRTIAVGAPTDDSNGANIGMVAVYNYVIGSGDWIQLGSSLFGDPGSKEFGYSISLSSNGKILAAGSLTHSSAQGYVKSYKYSGGRWMQLGCDLNGDGVNDQFGCSISLSTDGTTLAVGAPSDSSSESGYVKIFKYELSAWNEIGVISEDDPGSKFGSSISLSADGLVLVVGAYLNNGIGKVQVFQYAANAWAQLGTDLTGISEGDKFGFDVSVSRDGTTIAVCTRKGDYNRNNSGRVYLYQYQAESDSWGSFGGSIDGDSGDLISLVLLSSDGGTLAVGAKWADMGLGVYSNHSLVKVYNYVSGSDSWSPLYSVAWGENMDHNFGGSIALSDDGSIFVAGAYEMNNFVGAARVSTMVR